MSLGEAWVSVFRSATDAQPMQSESIEAILAGIRDGRWEKPVQWVEAQPVEAFREIILDRMCERVIAWLDHQMFKALQNPDLSEDREIVYERVRVERKAVVPKEGLQMSLF
jgi:hypothetical protein